MDINKLWVEKYRPSKLDDLIINQDTKDILESFRNKKDIPHLLFTSSAGTGKTSTAKIIVKDILGCDYLYINASDENGIDTIRTKVIGFAQTQSFDGGIKVVILDECLHEDTLITILRNGSEQQIPIKNVDESNDLVKTFNFTKNRIECRPFYKIDKDIQDVYEVEFENGEIICCTAEHKWYVKSLESDIPIRKKLIDIINERINEIVTINAPNTIKDIYESNTLTIKRITELDKQAHVYDLSVDETHNFFVGESQVLTSNCDSTTVDGQRALRNVMEEYSDHCRFILTGNYIHKIISPIKSRCQTISFESDIKSIIRRLLEILKNESILVDKDQLPLLVNLVRNNYPDIRRCINDIQRFSYKGFLNIKDSSLDTSFIENVYQRLAGDPVELRKFIISNETLFQTDYHNLLKTLLNHIYDKDIESNKKREAIIIISEYMHRHSFIIDIEINSFACMVQLSKLF